jgi:putative transposase
MATIRQKQSTYALTISTFQQHRHFQRAAHAELFIDKLFRYRDAGKFKLHAFAVMPDHVHILITPAVDQSTSRCIQLIKGGYSHAVRELTSYEVWHSGYHEHRIRDSDDLRNQLLYIANNPSSQNYPHVHTSPAYISRIDAPPEII